MAWQQQPPEQHQHHRRQRQQVEQAPADGLVPLRQQQRRQGCTQQNANGLKTKRREHHPTTNGHRHALSNHQMGNRIVSAESKADQQQADAHPERIGSEHHQRQPEHQQPHGGNEQGATAQAIGQGAEDDGSDQDADQAGGPERSLLEAAELELLSHHGQGEGTKEHHHPLEELARRGEGPDGPARGGTGGIHQRRCRRHQPI